MLGVRYAAGEHGAYALTDDAGGRYVLKWATAAASPRFATAATVAAELRGDGYPAPHYRFVGEVGGMAYAVLTALPGEPLVAPSASLLPHLFALNSLQVGRAAGGAGDWPRVLIHTLLQGGDGYCLPATLHAHSPETAKLLACCQAAARAAQHVRWITGDIVHFDFHPGNILSAAGCVSGVVDWEGTCAGDCAFDLATLLFYTYDLLRVRAALGAHLRQRLDPRIAALYFAHLIVRQVDWSIRYHDDAAVRGWLDTAHAVAADFLPAG